MAEEVKNEAPQTETPKSTGGTGLEPNVAALLAYLFGWVGGLVFFLIEKDNKFVRFAAMQSIMLNVAIFALYIILGMVSIITVGIGALLYPVLYIGFIVIWIMLMVKAYQNQEWELPVIGKLARNAIK
jgi:uncharacterized membrane protein